MKARIISTTAAAALIAVSGAVLAQPGFAQSAGSNPSSQNRDSQATTSSPGSSSTFQGSRSGSQPGATYNRAESRGSPAVPAGDAEYGKAMQRLFQAAQRLRESVQAMANMPAGEQRNRAMDTARAALMETQQAMISANAANMAESGRSRGNQATGSSGRPSSGQGGGQSGSSGNPGSGNTGSGNPSSGNTGSGNTSSGNTSSGSGGSGDKSSGSSSSRN